MLKQIQQEEALKKMDPQEVRLRAVLVSCEGTAVQHFQQEESTLGGFYEHDHNNVRDRRVCTTPDNSLIS